MFYKEYPPGKELEYFVKCFWVLEHDYSKQPFNSGERVWPDGHFEFILTFSKPYFRIEKGVKTPLPNNFLIGQFNRELMLNSFGKTRIVAIRFNAWGLFPFLKVGMAGLANRLTELSELFGSSIKDLMDRVDGLDQQQAVDLLRDFIIELTPTIDNDSKLVAEMVKDIYDRDGVVIMKELLQKYPIGPRKLQRMFKEHVGLSAKHFSKIIRFNKAKKLIESNPSISLTRLAFECGYSDQSHFTKNFREFYGISPGLHRKRVEELRMFFEN